MYASLGNRNYGPSGSSHLWWTTPCSLTCMCPMIATNEKNFLRACGGGPGHSLKSPGKPTVRKTGEPGFGEADFNLGSRGRTNTGVFCTRRRRREAARLLYILEARSASRIDRFYVCKTWTLTVQQVQVQLPVSFSDHQQITLHVSSKGPPERHRGQPRPVIYPICTSTPTQVHGDLVDELIRMGVGRNVDSRSWDTTVQKCGTNIKRIRIRDNQRLRRMRRRFRIQARTHLLSWRAIL
uniref:Uncharacterized protein n=1 Tax=Hyaloperonospora arabidopsidis (strain Emoy2) TaxID=559515 RepID=M4BIM7_HYAAE